MRRSTQLRPTLFHLHLHSVSLLGYLSDPNHRHCPSLRRMLRGESLAAAAARPIEGRRADYGFVGSVEAEIRRRIAEDIRYGIRDAWIDLRDIAEEEALTTLEGVNTKVIELAALQEQDTQDIYGVMEDLVCQEEGRIGHLVTALGEIQALQAREQARTGTLEAAGSST
nr:hypothetical protein [Tanacetum cinerariifolium]